MFEKAIGNGSDESFTNPFHSVNFKKAAHENEQE